MKSFFLLLYCSTLFLHPLKMSFSRMTFGVNNYAIIETRLFLDDLSYHIGQKYRLKEPEFTTINSNGTKALQKYIHENFYILQGDKKVNLNIESLDFTKGKIALIIHLKSVTNIEPKKHYQINNTLLFDAFKKQENRLQINTPESQKKHFIFNINTPTLL
ncbi:DUF6702 family protein [Pseudofulvibacter geojedonensis]|uniref:DUF6702 family protein n=1 Tax=Pseudofulvibacter geojedonensis TaxID=1123758 RepID=A0ABW3I5C4_9FLAO